MDFLHVDINLLNSLLKVLHTNLGPFSWIVFEDYLITFSVQ